MMSADLLDVQYWLNRTVIKKSFASISSNKEIWISGKEIHLQFADEICPYKITFDANMGYLRIISSPVLKSLENIHLSHYSHDLLNMHIALCPNFDCTSLVNTNSQSMPLFKSLRLEKLKNLHPHNFQNIITETLVLEKCNGRICNNFALYENVLCEYLEFIYAGVLRNISNILLMKSLLRITLIGELHHNDYWTRDGNNPVSNILNKYLQMKNNKIEYMMDMSLEIIDIGYSDLL